MSLDYDEALVWYRYGPATPAALRNLLDRIGDGASGPRTADGPADE
jgi:hypothetical protein